MKNNNNIQKIATRFSPICESLGITQSEEIKIAIMISQDKNILNYYPFQ